MITEHGFVQIHRRCAVQQNDPPNHVLWDVLWDNKMVGRVTVHGGQVNLAYGKLPAGVKLADIKSRLKVAGQLS